MQYLTRKQQHHAGASFYVCPQKNPDFLPEKKQIKHNDGLHSSRSIMLDFLQVASMEIGPTDWVKP